jgi:hypothetical protein
MAILVISCQPSPKKCANALFEEAQLLVEQGMWRQAMLVLDSIHATYPKQVFERRLAKSLADSITYLEAKNTLAYTDSLLPPLLDKVDKLLPLFRYEKNQQYEDHGKYVHKLLTTGSNTSRNFLQAYVRDDRETIVKSYYYGSRSVGQQSIVLQAGGEQQTFTGSNHHFEAGAHHEIMTIENDNALALLNFVSSHINDRIRIVGTGVRAQDTWVYYLSDKEKKALSDTYQLGWLMKDIKHFEQIQQIANKQILHYQHKKELY